MQRKKKRSIIFELHSIPIKNRSLCTQKNFKCKKSLRHLRERLYLVSYSIPFSCMAMLLLLVVGCVAVKANNDEVYASDEAGEATPREALPATVSLKVGGDRNGEVETGVGVTAYRSHTVDVTVSDVQEYFLKISGSTELAPPAGGTAVPGVGTEGVKGVDMPENTWGYAWNSNAAAAGSDENMLYTSMPSSATSLSVPNLQDGNASFSGKLSFGAKFAETSVLGNYTSGVTLSLIATPKSNTGSNHGFWINAEGAETGLDSGTASLQDAEPNFCKGNDQVGIGWTVELEDNRDGKTYTVVKLPDGNCWMQDNLALEADPEKYPDGMVLAPGDTDLPAGVTWTLPVSTTNFSTNNTAVQVATGSTSMSGWQEGYGNYYSWVAATAETGGASSINSGSICPKGWTLPTGNTGGQFYNALNGLNFTSIQQDPYKFPAAGTYNGSSLGYVGTRGRYWSRTNSGDSSAFMLVFDDSSFTPATAVGLNHVGLPVRCVQSGVPMAKWSNGLDSGVNYMQEVSRNNFTNKFCSKSQNSLVPEKATLSLKDIRDKKTYTIVKLADGNCWMQQNLALGPNTLLTSADSDVSSNYTTPADTSSFNTSSDPANGQMRVGSTSLNGNWKTEWGNYYSWNAATAGTGRSATAQGANATSSICPKGWKLPTGNATGANTVNQFQNLFGENGANLGSSSANRFTAVQAAPYKFPAAGFYDGTSLGYPGTYGYYWSRTSDSSINAYNLHFYSSNFYPGTYNNYRYLGFSVRCVAESTS